MKQKFVPALIFVMILAIMVAAMVDTRPSTAAPVGEGCLEECQAYMPFQRKPLPTATPTATPTPTVTPTVLPLDFTVTDIEVFQATQTDDNAVPLVAGKTAVARIFAQILAGSSPNNVQVSLTAVRNGSTLGTINASGPTTVPSSPAHSSYNTTYNVILPNSWLSGQVKLTAKVDSANAHSETNENNNKFDRTVDFHSVPDLQIRLIPIRYVHNGPTDPGTYSAQAVDNISDWIDRAYPMDDIDVEIRSAYTFSGNLENATPCFQNPPGSDCDWYNLLNDMYLLKVSDGLPDDTPIVYYGLIPIRDGSDRWFFSGIAGIGWISNPGQIFRESIGLNFGGNDDTGILAGHEIGHNLGRRHAPCGGAGGPDPAYPYAGASIGEYGTDIEGNNVSFYTPSNHVDMMSYCSPEWVSDYTYKALYNNQRDYGLAQPIQTADHLVIRATFIEGDLNLAPVYALAIANGAEPAVSDVMVELLDSQGAVIATQPVPVREAQEEGIHIRSVLGNVPLPAAATVASIRLVENGVVLAERQLAQPQQRLAQAALAIRQTGDTVTLEWGLPGVPAIVRYTTDEGASWTTLALDVLTGTHTLSPSVLAADGRFEIILADTSAPAGLTADFIIP